jgi:hypothetical protein
MVTLRVTYMEMNALPREMAPSPSNIAVQINREVLDQTSYLYLYRAVGEPLHWDQQLRMPNSDLQAFLGAPTTHVFVLRLDGQVIGLCEFDGVGNPQIEVTMAEVLPALLTAATPA